MDRVRLSDIKDGTSYTIAIGEVTKSGFCCRPAPTGTTRWQGGSGSLRVNTSRVVRSSLIAPASWNSDHTWVLAAGHGQMLTAAGDPGHLGGAISQWWNGGVAHMMFPVYYDHYAMGVEWPGAGSTHPGGAQFALADGSSRFISETISTGNAVQGGTNANMGINGNVWVAAHTIQGSQHGQTETTVSWP
jgi:hypothetical protein